MLVLASSRCGDAFSVDAWLAQRRAPWSERGARPSVPSGEYRWPIQLVRLLMVLVFFAAGVAKLRFGRAAWFDPGNMAAILIQPHYAIDRSLPSLGLWIASSPVATAVLAATTVLAETAAPLALLGGPAGSADRRDAVRHAARQRDPDRRPRELPRTWPATRSGFRGHASPACSRVGASRDQSIVC